MTKASKKPFKLKGFAEIDRANPSRPTYLVSSQTLPLVPVRDLVLFPRATMPSGPLENKLRSADLSALEEGELTVVVVHEKVLEAGVVSSGWYTRARFINLTAARWGYLGVMTGMQRVYVDAVSEKRLGKLASCRPCRPP